MDCLGKVFLQLLVRIGAGSQARKRVPNNTCSNAALKRCTTPTTTSQEKLTICVGVGVGVLRLHRINRLTIDSIPLGRANGLLQFGVFGVGLDEDWHIGVGVFPGGEEILVGGAGFGFVALKHVGAGQI